tara:strand:+ start:1083 stop:1331 length:249 start_codon:yes stop_codon:yes gene_type:complete
MSAITLNVCAFCNTVKEYVLRIQDAYKKRQANATTLRTLSMLSNAELHDIGICRGDIPYIAKGGRVYRGRFGYTTDKEKELV